MKIILEYVKDNYHLPYYSLFTLDPNSKFLKQMRFSDYITPNTEFLVLIVIRRRKNMDSVHSLVLKVLFLLLIGTCRNKKRVERS